MIEFKANERTFPGILLSAVKKIVGDNPGIKFGTAILNLKSFNAYKQ